MSRHELGLFDFGRGSIFIYLSAFHYDLSAEIYHLDHTACETECGKRIHGDTRTTELIELAWLDENKVVTEIEAEEQGRSLVDKVA